MSSVRRTALFAWVLTLAVSACKESTTGPGEPLDLIETEALFAGIGARMADSASVIVSTEDSFVVECPLGGRMAVEGDIVDETKRDTLHIETDLMLVPEGCGFPSRNLDFTITGSVSMESDLWLVDFFPVEAETGVSGSVDWYLEDRWGTCGIDLALNQDTGGRYSGTMCGLDVEFDVASFIPTASGGARWSSPGSSATLPLRLPAT